jgi:hypothetical protein
LQGYVFPGDHYEQEGNRQKRENEDGRTENQFAASSYRLMRIIITRSAVQINIPNALYYSLFGVDYGTIESPEK